ncbi:MAG: hypothetical protein JNM56_38845 [Planctomycetia bacterium]|nr:hypothetical protein [Planctomycetia bacterium]
MADKPSQLILDALSRAAAEPAGVPLFGGKGAPGLFPATAPSRLAALHCKEENYLRVLRTEQRGRTAVELCAITERGMALLLNQLNPKQVLENLVRALDERQEQSAALVTAAQQTQASIEAMRATVEKALQALAESPPAHHLPPRAWHEGVLTFLHHWQTQHPMADCALPEVYEQAQRSGSYLSIGEFHDGLRQLHERQLIYLHPWTGPLYDIPQPALALMVGHELAYYVSVRK